MNHLETQSRFEVTIDGLHQALIAASHGTLINKNFEVVDEKSLAMSPKELIERVTKLSFILQSTSEDFIYQIVSLKLLGAKIESYSREMKLNSERDCQLKKPYFHRWLLEIKKMPFPDRLYQLFKNLAHNKKALELTKADGAIVVRYIQLKAAEYRSMQREAKLLQLEKRKLALIQKLVSKHFLISCLENYRSYHSILRVQCPPDFLQTAKLEVVSAAVKFFSGFTLAFQSRDKKVIELFDYLLTTYRTIYQNVADWQSLIDYLELVKVFQLQACTALEYDDAEELFSQEREREPQGFSLFCSQWIHGCYDYMANYTAEKIQCSDAKILAELEYSHELCFFPISYDLQVIAYREKVLANWEEGLVSYLDLYNESLEKRRCQYRKVYFTALRLFEKHPSRVQGFQRTAIFNPESFNALAYPDKLLEALPPILLEKPAGSLEKPSKINPHPLKLDAISPHVIKEHDFIADIIKSYPKRRSERRTASNRREGKKEKRALKSGLIQTAQTAQTVQALPLSQKALPLAEINRAMQQLSVSAKPTAPSRSSTALPNAPSATSSATTSILHRNLIPSASFRYSDRVMRWFDPSRQPLLEDAKYSALTKPEVIERILLFHKIATSADAFVFEYGSKRIDKSHTGPFSDRAYSYTLPGEIECWQTSESGKQKVHYRGVFTICAVGQDIYHRCFTVKPTGEIFNEAAKGFFYFEEDFWQEKKGKMKSLVKPIFRDKSYIVEDNASKGYLTFIDPTNDAVLHLMLLKNL